jgi:MOSC domain-containing protein YiiM
MHLSFDAIAAGLRALPAPPKDAGKVTLVVARPEVDARRLPERIMLTPDAGVTGDRWGKRPGANPDAQITVMRDDVGRLVGNGQRLELFGDNLVVDLDLSTENLPAGTQLRVGDALCVVTPQPHTGCAKYSARFGEDARRLLSDPEFADWRLRGIYIRVLEAGEVGPGDAVRVLSRPA